MRRPPASSLWLRVLSPVWRELQSRECTEKLHRACQDGSPEIFVVSLGIILNLHSSIPVRNVKKQDFSYRPRGTADL